MKRMNLLMLFIISVLFLGGCQKDVQKLEDEEVSFESLEGEYGIQFTPIDNNDMNTISMSLDELKDCLEELTNLSGKKIKANVIKESSLTRGGAIYIGSMVRIEEGNINVGRLIKIRVDYYQPDKFFNTYIYDQAKNITLYSSVRNTNIVSNMYGNVMYWTFVDNNCTVNVVVNLQSTTLKFKLQVDWDMATDNAEFTLFFK